MTSSLTAKVEFTAVIVAISPGHDGHGDMSDIVLVVVASSAVAAYSIRCC